MTAPGAETLAAGTGVDAASIELTHAPLPATEVLHGSPTTASAVITGLVGVGSGSGSGSGSGVESSVGVEIGVWEMTPGTASDIEADEVFVVLSGRATIAFDDADLPDLEVGPGTLVRLAEGQRTIWTVTETLRKIYIV